MEKSKEFTRKHLIEELEWILSSLEEDGLYALPGIKHRIDEYKEGQEVIENLKKKYVIDSSDLNKSRNGGISLINYEGSCLKAVRGEKGNIAIYDQYGELADLLDREEFLQFIEGHISIFDSEGKEWIWTKESKEARPTLSEIFNFINRR